MTGADRSVDGPVHGPVHGLGPEWVVGPDGVRSRRAARVILLDDAGRVLLLHGCDVDQRERSWWFTVGGGIDAGETSRHAAVRELFEETGIAIEPGTLVGPVYSRSAMFDFFRESCRQQEVFYLGHYRERAGADTGQNRVADGAGGDPELSRDGWTQIEVETLDDLRWWDLDALATVEEEVFPEGLSELVRDLLGGWDGVTRNLDG